MSRNVRTDVDAPAILRFGDPRLAARCAPVATDGLGSAADDAERMFAAIHAFRAHHGRGRAIAAPQIGVLRRIVAIDDGGARTVMANPTIDWASEARTELWDDCMSAPEIAVRVLRHDCVTVRYTDLYGRECAFERAPLALSELLQHELDHLDGVLMTDRMVPGTPVVAHENRALAEPLLRRPDADPSTRSDPSRPQLLPSNEEQAMTKRYIVDVPGVPASPSPISNAVVVGDTCHISGQVAMHEDGFHSGTAREEAERAFELVFLIATEAGFKRDDIVYVDLAFADLGDMPEVNALYGELFPINRPARTVYEAKRLPAGAKVKVQAVAMR